MLAPTPLLPLRPLGVGDVLSATMAILRSRFGLLIGIAALGVLVPLLLAVVPVILLMWMTITEAMMGPRSLDPAWAVGVFGGLLLCIVIGGLVTLKVEGLFAEITYQTAQGRRVALREAWEGNRGFVRRILPFLLLVGLAVGVLYFGVIGAMLIAQASLAGGYSAEPFALVLLPILLVVWLVAIHLSIRWLYCLASAALEGNGGLAAARRSWGLTARAFWRTLGYFLMSLLVVWAISVPMSVVAQFLGMIPALVMFDQPMNDPAAFLGVLAPVLIAMVAVSVLVQMFTWPCVSVYRTVMFLDQVRRVEFAQGFVPPTPPAHSPAPDTYYTWQPGNNEPQGGATPQNWGPAPSPWSNEPPADGGSAEPPTLR